MPHPDFIPDAPDTGGFVPDVPRGTSPPPEWLVRLISTLPAAGATAGGIIGGGAGAIAIPGVGGVPGAIGGGAIGATGGRALENVIRQGMGLAPQRGMLEQMGVPIPPQASQATDLLEQAGLGALTEGVGAGTFGIPGKSPGGIAQTAGKIAKKAEDKSVAQALEKVRVVAKARNIEPETQAAAQAAKVARQKAGAEVGAKLGQHAKETVSLDEVVDHIANEQYQSFGTAANRKHLREQIRKRLRQVLPEHTLGAVSGKADVYDLPLANEVKRAFAAMRSGAHAGQARGITPKPTLDMGIENAYRDLIETKAPGIEGVNREAQRAIREHKDVLRLSNLGRSNIVQGLRQTQRERTAEALARQQGYESLFEPNIGLHGISIRTAPVGRFAAATERTLNRPRVAAAGRYSPDAINALLRLLSQPNMESNLPPDMLAGP